MLCGNIFVDEKNDYSVSDIPAKICKDGLSGHFLFSIIFLKMVKVLMP